MRRLVSLLVVSLTALPFAGCSETSEPTTSTTTTTVGPGADSPVQAVTELLDALSAGDNLAAARLTVPGQLVVVAMAEGITAREAMLLVETGADEVGVNFWSGFVESLSSFMEAGPADLRIGEVAQFVADGVEFGRIEMFFPLDGTMRQFVVQDTAEGWKIDVVATFASALAPKLGPAADLVRAEPDAAPVHRILQDQKPSLEAVLADTDVTPQLNQAIIAAIEAITR